MQISWIIDVPDLISVVAHQMTVDPKFIVDLLLSCRIDSDIDSAPFFPDGVWCVQQHLFFLFRECSANPDLGDLL